jgi:hypothetical protein
MTRFSTPIPRSTAGTREAAVSLRKDGLHKTLTERDAAAFLSQRGSSPIRREVAGCEGPYLILSDGRRVLDFRGNGCHHLGYRSPRVLAAVREQMGVGSSWKCTDFWIGPSFSQEMPIYLRAQSAHEDPSRRLVVVFERRAPAFGCQALDLGVVRGLRELCIRRLVLREIEKITDEH